MKVVFVLAIVLVVAAVVINAEEDHKKKHHERKHGNKDHKDRHHEKKHRNKDDHHGKKDRHHAEKHEGKKDREHKKHEEKKDRSSERHGGNHMMSDRNKKHDRAGEPSACPANKKPCCNPNRCQLSCKDRDNGIRFVECMYKNWWADFMDRFSGPDAEPKPDPTAKPDEEVDPTEKPEIERAKEACTPQHADYKCVCEDGYFLNEKDDSCVAREECPKDETGEPGGKGEGEEPEE